MTKWLKYDILSLIMPNGGTARTITQEQLSQEAGLRPELKATQETPESALENRGAEGIGELGEQKYADIVDRLREGGALVANDTHAEADDLATLKAANDNAEGQLNVARQEFRTAVNPFVVETPITPTVEQPQVEAQPVAAPTTERPPVEPFQKVDVEAEKAAFEQQFPAEPVVEPAESTVEVDHEVAEREMASEKLQERIQKSDQDIAEAVKLEQEYSVREDEPGKLYTLYQTRARETAQADKNLAERQIAFIEAKGRGAEQSALDTMQAEIGQLEGMLAAAETQRKIAEGLYNKSLEATKNVAPSPDDGSAWAGPDAITVKLNVPPGTEGSKTGTPKGPEGPGHGGPKGPKKEKKPGRLGRAWSGTKTGIKSGAYLTAFGGLKLLGKLGDGVDSMLTMGLRLLWNRGKLVSDIKENFSKGWATRGALRGTLYGLDQTFFSRVAEERAKALMTTKQKAEEAKQIREKREEVGA